MRASRRRRLEREDRGADIAAQLGLVPGAFEQMRDQRRGGRLAVGAGDGDEHRVGGDFHPIRPTCRILE